MWCHGKSCTCFNFLAMLCRLKAHIFCEQNYFVLASLQELRSHDWHWFCSSNPNYHICCVVDNSVVCCAQLCMLYVTLGLSVALWFNRSSIYREWISSLVPWHPSSTHACPSVEFCGPFKKGQPPRRILHGVRQITSGILRLCRPFGMTATNGRDLWPTSCRVLRQHWCPCFGQMDFYLIGKGVSVLDVIVAISKRQPLKSVVACQSTDAALTSAKPTSIHTMLIPSSSKAHSFGNPGCSAPASSQSCFACCCSSPSTSQYQSHWRYGQTRLPIAWSLGGGARKIHSLWHRKKWLDVEADEATFDKKVVNKQLQWEQWCGLVQRGGLTPWYCTVCVHYRPSFEHQAQVLCARWNGCSSPKNGCRTGTWSFTQT